MAKHDREMQREDGNTQHPVQTGTHKQSTQQSKTQQIGDWHNTPIKQTQRDDSILAGADETRGAPLSNKVFGRFESTEVAGVKRSVPRLHHEFLCPFYQKKREFCCCRWTFFWESLRRLNFSFQTSWVGFLETFWGRSAKEREAEKYWKQRRKVWEAWLLISALTELLSHCATEMEGTANMLVSASGMRVSSIAHPTPADSTALGKVTSMNEVGNSVVGG